jgi:hypothetical protein
MANISTDAMEEASEIFTGSLNHVLSNLVGESKASVKEFIMHVVLFRKPFMLVTPEGIADAVDLVFSKAEHRDFVLSLHYIFFSRLGNTAIDIGGLFGNLARGLGFNTNTHNAYMPRDISSRLASEEGTVSILNENKWLVIIIMLILCVSLDDTEFVRLTNDKKQIRDE